MRTLDAPTPPSYGGGGSSGSSNSIVVENHGGLLGYSGGVCVTQWNCSSWSECKDNLQVRNCNYPSNWCTPVLKIPDEKKTCVMPVQESSSVVNQNKTNENLSQASSPGITGAAIGAVGKYSIVGVLAFLIIVGIGYVINMF